MNEPARLNIPEWTVSDLAAALRRTVEDAFGYVRVRGEISGYRGPHSSGHCYFALKDESAKIEAVVWRSAFARMRIKPEEGLEVLSPAGSPRFRANPNIRSWWRRSSRPGVGALMAVIEERKKQACRRGAVRCRAQAAAAFPARRNRRDHVAGRRSYSRHPAPTAGPVSAARDCLAGAGAGRRLGRGSGGRDPRLQRACPRRRPIRRPDLIIVARGGGSIEDLWSFNEEIVVRAAAASMIPLIAAVGHETDVTLIDFAADLRAPTPSAAAEMAVPVRTELLLRVDAAARRALACWQRCQEARHAELRAATRALPNAENLLALPRQRLDHAAARLPRALTANAQIHHAQFSRIAGRLTPHFMRARTTRCRELLESLAERARRAERIAHRRRQDRLVNSAARLAAGVRANAESHRARIARARERVTSLADRSERAMQLLLRDRAASVDRCEELLNALSHRGVLARGFALVRDRAGHPLRHAAAVKPPMPLDIEFFDGHVRASAEASILRDNQQPASRRRARRAIVPGQGSLFE